jgi:hypothetical protein
VELQGLNGLSLAFTVERKFGFKGRTAVGLATLFTAECLLADEISIYIGLPSHELQALCDAEAGRGRAPERAMWRRAELAFVA